MKYDCSEGCPDTVDEVCALGTTFQNACIAQCQGEGNYVMGSCSDSDTSSRKLRRGRAKRSFLRGGGGVDGRISPSTIHRFDSEGFKFIGTMKNTEPYDTADNSVQELVVERPDDTFDEDEEQGEMNTEGLDNDGLYRVTPDGEVYYGKTSSTKIAEEMMILEDAMQNLGKPQREEKQGELDFHAPLPRPEYDVGNGNGQDMNLNLIIGQDNRSRVSSSPGWPYWRVAKIAGCSATIVGRNKVLTNAHCVRNRANTEWNVPSIVEPGKNPTAIWGSWNVDYATITTNYYNSNNNVVWEEDYAIITTKNDNWTGQDIGQYMGFFPIATTSCETFKSNSVKKRVVGYPGDKPSNTMWDSNSCSWEYTCGNKVVKHTCDIWYGSSGSGMQLHHGGWGDISIIGVNSFTAGTINGGPAFTPEIAAMLRAW
jgi:V8-like Glu-specific endopeptidase